MMADDTKSEQAAGPHEAHGVEALRSRVLGFFPSSSSLLLSSLELSDTKVYEPQIRALSRC